MHTSYYDPFNNIKKNFRKDLETLLSMLKDNKKFSFSKYADGEYAILRNISITVQPCDNWTFTADVDSKYRNALMDSFTYYEPGYYVGISCPCCQPMSHVSWMRDTLTTPKEYVTWANLFVNGNYNFFIQNFIPEFKKRKVVIVASEKGNASNLPFKVDEYIPIKQTAWRDNYNLVDSMPFRGDKDVLYLFCAGPLGNMLAHRMWKQNKNNTYMDIGSTLNPWLVGKNRDYMHVDSPYAGQGCIW